MSHPDILTLNGRQRAALATVTPQCNNICYPTCEIAEESGELADKIRPLIQWNPDCPILERTLLEEALNKFISASQDIGMIAKRLRHGSCPVPFTLKPDITPEQRRDIALELGDIDWGISVTADQLGYTLQDIGSMNIDKLTIRKAQGTIDGQGDHERSAIIDK